MVDFLASILGRKSQEAYCVIWGGGGRPGRIGEKPTAYNGLELEEHLSLGSGAGSDLLETPASRDTSPAMRQKDVLHLKRGSLGGLGYADASFRVLGTASHLHVQSTLGLGLSPPERPC